MHNRKQKIGSPFEELIKDADCLAHGIEFPEDLSVYEEIRIKTAQQAPLQLGLMPIDKVQTLLQKNSEQLLNTFKSFDTKELPAQDVHALRVNIRGLRSIFGLLRNTGEWERYKKSDKALKVIFKSFERSRQLTVFRKSLKTAGVAEKAYRQVTKDIKKEDERAIKRLAKQVKQYKNSLVTSDVTSMENIHDIRIKGKLIKYLLDNQIVTLTPNALKRDLQEVTEDLDLITQLHNCIGKLHDIEENKCD